MSFLCFHLHEKGQLRADGRHNNTVTKREDCNLIKREWWECLANLDVFKSVMLMSFIFAYLRNCLKQYQNLNYYHGRQKRERRGKSNHVFKKEEKIQLYIPARKPSIHPQKNTQSFYKSNKIPEARAAANSICWMAPYQLHFRLWDIKEA